MLGSCRPKVLAVTGGLFHEAVRNLGRSVEGARKNVTGWAVPRRTKKGRTLTDAALGILGG